MATEEGFRRVNAEYRAHLSARRDKMLNDSEAFESFMAIVVETEIKGTLQKADGSVCKV
jgi:hypothetical protein